MTSYDCAESGVTQHVRTGARLVWLARVTLTFS